MRPQPVIRDIAYSFRRAFAANAFIQFPLLTVDRFGREAKKRGADLSFGSVLRDRLEEFDQVGALCPILFDVGTGTPVLREEVEFVPWAEYSVDDDGINHPHPYYAYWQLLYVADAIDLGQAPVSLDWIIKDDSARRLGEGYRPWFEAQRAVWQELDERWRASVLLLTRIQNRYGPAIKGGLGRSSSTTVYDAEARTHVDPYTEERRSFRAVEVLSDLGLHPAAVKEMHHRVAVHGETIDPNGSLHMLLRMAPFKERDKLEGPARRAQDAYDAAEMIRSFYYDVTGDLLPNPDEIFDISDKSWKQRIFGKWPIRSFTRADLQAELRRHDLWPHQVHLIVEGESEEVVCRRVIEELVGGEPERLGITFSRLDGVGKLRLHQEIVCLTRNFARWPVLIVDREGDVEREVAIMKREGLLSDDTAILWHSSFEEQHFSDDELVGVVLELANERGVDLTLTAAEFRHAYDDYRSRTGKEARGAATYLLSMAAHPRRGGLRLTKPELAERLAERLLADLRDRGDEAIEEHSILGVVVSILRVT